MEVTEWEIFSIFLFASSLWSIYLNNYSVAPAAKSLQLCPTLCAPWTAAYQASPSMGFSREEHWSGLPTFQITLPKMVLPYLINSSTPYLFSLFALYRGIMYLLEVYYPRLKCKHNKDRALASAVHHHVSSMHSSVFPPSSSLELEDRSREDRTGIF